MVPELDAGGAERTAIDIAAGLAAVGARALVVGLSPEIVHALVLLDAPIDGLDAEASVESALELLECGGSHAA